MRKINPVYLELRQIYCCKGAKFCRPTLEKAWKEIKRLEDLVEKLISISNQEDQ